jgi:hypothetical protein
MILRCGQIRFFIGENVKGLGSCKEVGPRLLLVHLDKSCSCYVFNNFQIDSSSMLMDTL